MDKANVDAEKLKEEVLEYCDAHNLTMCAFAEKAKVSQGTISKLGKGGVSSRTVALIRMAMSEYKPKKYILRIEKDGVVKYCHSYSPEITPQTMYWASADDDRMSIPYPFGSYKFAEYMFWQFKNGTGQKGWYFTITEVKDDTV